MEYLHSLTKFDEIYSITKKLTVKEKGDLFEIFVFHLFKLDPRLNGSLQDIWLYKDIPIYIIKKLQLPQKDKGIDALAIINDEYYAIQCKFRQNPEIIISWSELSTFFGLSFGINNKIKKGYFVTNTYDVCEEVYKSNKVIALTGAFLCEIEKCVFGNIKTGKFLHKLSPKYPFDYQKECIKQAWLHFVSHDRCYVEMACGTGKTLLSYWLDEKMAINKKTVIFVPSLQLLSQFYRDFVNQNYAENRKINYLLIGSSADVGMDVMEKTNGLLLITCPKQIQKYITDEIIIKTKGGEYKFVQKLIIICTYQSADKLIEASKNITFDLGIYDEAHKTVGLIHKKFGLTLANKNIKIRKRFFMTATPKIYNDIENDVEILSMNDDKNYGKKIFTFNTGDAIKQKKLVDYQILSIVCQNTNIKKTIKDNKLVSVNNTMKNLPSNYLSCIIILLKKIHDNTVNHLVTYHNRIKHSRSFAEYLQQINKILYADEKDIFIDYLDGKHSMSYRNKVIKSFIEHKKGILCSSRVLNEGVNIIEIDSICFVDARTSTIDIIQCIGRALRLYKNKKIASIIVPIFVDDIEKEQKDDRYNMLIKILKALKNTDSGMLRYIKSKGKDIKYFEKVCTFSCYDEDNSASIDIDISKWHDDIKTKIWKLVDNWNDMYIRLKKWIDAHEKLPKKTNSCIVENKLHMWCQRQRENYKNNNLSSSRQEKLSQLQNWMWEMAEEKYIKTTYFGISVTVMKENGYINATKLCKYANSKQQFSEWRKTNHCNKCYDFVSKNINIKKHKLEYKDNNNSDSSLRGTYVHPLLTFHIISWINVELSTKFFKNILEHATEL